MKRRGSNPIDLGAVEQDKPVVKRVPFTLSKAQSTAMRHHMFEIDGYKTTEKSRWLSEALASLLSYSHWIDVVEGVMMSQREATENHIVLMDERLKLKLDEACLNLKKNAFDGKIEKVRAPVAVIMRAAVMHRINPVSDAISDAIKLAKLRMAEKGIVE